MRQTCTAHCTGCGRHFHGLAAFTAHQRDHACQDPATATDERGVRLLQAWTEAGSCDLEPGCWEEGRRVRWVEPVTVWQGRQTGLGLRLATERREAQARAAVR